jgi:ATP-binding cassette subfamily B protein
MIHFMHITQDAKISMERLGEIHKEENEEKEDRAEMIVMPESKTLEVRDVSFRYEGPYSRKVLDGLNLELPASKVTAVVGVSGSGKTTLIKLLLSFYPPIEGEIRVGDTNLQSLSPQLWRRRCGVVMQDGFVFSDTIAKNIALGEEYVDPDRLLMAVRMANIKDFIESLPLAYNTKVGTGGQSLSGGEKQRILIARAVYKQPEFLFIDEGTSSLDAENEKIIIDNLQEFFTGRTVVVVAHRLSTVRNADQIVVLDRGKIAEIGPHDKLIEKRGSYYELVKNQLELGE